jgi:sugar transferase (PEP-CTERM/EpsH1 system associated)
VNILFLTPQLPFPPRQGTAIRNWGLISHLAERHEISLLSFVEAGQPPVSAELQTACRQVVTVPVPRRTRLDRLRTLLSPQPDMARRLWSPEFAGALARVLDAGAFDFVHIEGIEMAPYLPIVTRPAAGRRRPSTLYDAHNAEYLIQRRAFLSDLRLPSRWPAAFYSLAQVPRLRRFEADTCRAVDRVTCVSAEDAGVLRRLVPGLQPLLVPNGIDIVRYATGVSPAPQARSPYVVFTGKMDYRPNVDAALWFAREILPLIRARRPEMQFYMVGQKPLTPLRKLDGRGGIVVTGLVDDARPYVAGAAVYVAPLRMGGGTRFKLLEAMALSRPIVSTRLGAEGFEVHAGRELLLADSPSAFAEAVLTLLDQPLQAQTLARAGYAFVKAGYDWSVIMPRLEAAYR